MRNMLNPLWPNEISGLVLARVTISSERPAKVHHVLLPFKIQPPSVGLAFKLTAATSEPVFGSVIDIAQSVSPEANLGSQNCCWLSVPPANNALAAISGLVIKLPAAPKDPLDNSSVTTIIPRLSDLLSGWRPPNFSGMQVPKHPNSDAASMICSGISKSSR